MPVTVLKNCSRFSSSSGSSLQVNWLSNVAYAMVFCERQKGFLYRSCNNSRIVVGCIYPFALSTGPCCEGLYKRGSSYRHHYRRRCLCFRLNGLRLQLIIKETDTYISQGLSELVCLPNSSRLCKWLFSPLEVSQLNTKEDSYFK